MVKKKVEIASSEDSRNREIRQFVLVATFLPLKSFWTIISFMRLSNKIEKQLRESRGLVRYALKTDIPHKRFWTISVWTSRDDMALFSRSEPHRTAMKRFFDWGTDRAAIVEWSNSNGAIDWHEADSMLEKPTLHYRFDEKNKLVREES